MLQTVKGSYDLRYSHRFHACSHMLIAYFILPSKMAQAVKLLTYQKGPAPVTVETQVVLTEIFGSSSQSFQADAGIVPQIRA
jgi:hypothetical protein